MKMTIQSELSEIVKLIEERFPKVKTSGQPNLEQKRMEIYKSVISDIQERIAEIYALLTREITLGNFSSSYRLASKDEIERRHSIVDTLQTLSLAIMTKVNTGCYEAVFATPAFDGIVKICVYCYGVDTLLLETPPSGSKSSISKGLVSEKSYTDYKTKAKVTMVPTVMKDLKPGPIKIYRSPLTAEELVQIKQPIFAARSKLDSDYVPTNEQIRFLHVGGPNPQQFAATNMAILQNLFPIPSDAQPAQKEDKPTTGFAGMKRGFLN